MLALRLDELQALAASAGRTAAAVRVVPLRRFEPADPAGGFAAGYGARSLCGKRAARLCSSMQQGRQELLPELISEASSLELVYERVAALGAAGGAPLHACLLCSHQNNCVLETVRWSIMLRAVLVVRNSVARFAKTLFLRVCVVWWWWC